MKKIISVLAALAAVFSLASCSVNGGQTTAERVSEIEIEMSQMVEESIQAETKRAEKIVKTVKDIGKTKKNEQLVVKVDYANGEHYQVFVMNKKGICQKVNDYYFYDTLELFNINNEKQKEKTRMKKIDSDPETRMIAYESDYTIEERNKFDQLYELYSNEESKAQGFTVIE